MTDEQSRSQKSNTGQFPKGRSGNPKGRPRGSGKRSPTSSAVEVLLDKTLTVTKGGISRQLTMEEALQERTFNDALAGKRLAMREVLKWIAAYEAWQAKHAPKPPPRLTPFLVSPSPRNVDEALVLLGIAAHDPDRAHITTDRAQLLIEPWAAQLALRRMRGYLDQRQREDIQRATRDPHSLVWPS